MTPRGRHFLKIMEALTFTCPASKSTTSWASAIRIFSKYPVIYLCEPGPGTERRRSAHCVPAEGRLSLMDDMRFNDWEQSEMQMSRVFPTGKWEASAPPDLHSFYEIQARAFIEL